ncbi:MAG: DUF1576 domain-containing protein [Christensenellaceae bacterium]
MDTANTNDNLIVEELDYEQLQRKNSRSVFLYTLFWSLCFLVASPVGAVLSSENLNIFYDFYLILITPSKLVTDYFNIGGLGSTLLNAGLCGLCCNLLMLVSKTRCTATTLAGYLLVVAHCFYGLNLINMWPSIIGVAVYCLFKKENFGKNLHIAMFSTSLAPFSSEFIFRYTIGASFVFGEARVTLIGVLLAIVLGIFAGFIIPALLPGTTRMYRGFSLYKAGLAIGLFGVFIYAFMYKNFNFQPEEIIVRDNPLYDGKNKSYAEFMFSFFAIIFIVTIIYGFLKNEKSLKGYKTILDCDGYQDNFIEKAGFYPTLINIGTYGFSILLYIGIITLVTEGAGFTGPTSGVIIAAITFSACGQNIKNVWPIVVGYIILYIVTLFICKIAVIEMPWTLSSQGYINGLAFATGLCPFTGVYGRKYGILAGFICAIVCTSTSSMHGGFVLYNGGFSAGLTAMVLLPILDHYNVKKKLNTL